MDQEPTVPLSASFWAGRGLPTNPPMRTQILELAIDEVALNGSEHFRAAEICDRLFIARSLINHHFGNQSRLIVEATVTAYERYVNELKQAALIASTPRERLEAWIIAQAKWFAENRGTATLLQLPHPSFTQIINELFGERMEQIFQYNMAVLGTLVKGIQRNELLPLDFDRETAPYTEVPAGDMHLLLRTASVGLSSLGSSVWSAAQEMPSHNNGESYLTSAILTQHAKWISGAVANEPL